MSQDPGPPGSLGGPGSQASAWCPVPDGPGQLWEAQDQLTRHPPGSPPPCTSEAWTTPGACQASGVGRLRKLEGGDQLAFSGDSDGDLRGVPPPQGGDAMPVLPPALTQVSWSPKPPSQRGPEEFSCSAELLQRYQHMVNLPFVQKCRVICPNGDFCIFILMSVFKAYETGNC